MLWRTKPFFSKKINELIDFLKKTTTSTTTNLCSCDVSQMLFEFFCSLFTIEIRPLHNFKNNFSKINRCYKIRKSDFTIFHRALDAEHPKFRHLQTNHSHRLDLFASCLQLAERCATQSKVDKFQKVRRICRELTPNLMLFISIRL